MAGKKKPQLKVVFLMLNVSVHFLKLLTTRVALQFYDGNNKKEIQRVPNFLQRFAQQRKTLNSHKIFDFQTLT